MVQLSGQPIDDLFDSRVEATTHKAAIPGFPSMSEAVKPWKHEHSPARITSVYPLRTQDPRPEHASSSVSPSVTFSWGTNRLLLPVPSMTSRSSEPVDSDICGPSRLISKNLGVGEAVEPCRAFLFYRWYKWQSGAQ